MAGENEFQPGFGKAGEIENCFIDVSGDPGVVTVKFSTDAGETLLVMGVEWAEVVAEMIVNAASVASKPETTHLRLVGGGRER